MNTTPAMPYDRWIEDAMRSVVRRALQQVAAEGLPGAHHLYVSFATGAPGVGLADELRARYAEEMTIVLQHQFWDLAIDDGKFEVTLKFHGRMQRLVVPFAAVTGFVDPSVNFALQFRPAPVPDSEQGEGGVMQAAAAEAAPGGGATASVPSAVPSTVPGEVITLDRFRKK
jgi:hypothetical protein